MLFRVIPLLFLALACSRVSNTYQDAMLVCGADLPRGQDYFTVAAANGEALTTGFEVVELQSRRSLPLITRNGCVQLPTAGSYLIRSQTAEEAVIINAHDIRPRENVRLLDYSHDSLTIDCSDVPRPVSPMFTLVEIIKTNVQNNLVPAFDVQVEMDGTKQTLGLLEASHLPLLANSRKEGVYDLKVQIIDLLKHRQTEKVCPLSLDLSAPQVELQVNARPASDLIEVHSRKNIITASPADSLSFQGDGDTASIRYCLIPLDDNFENLDSEAGKTWLAQTENGDCHDQVEKETLTHQPILTDIKSRFWALRFQPIDAVGNAASYQTRLLLITDRDAQRSIRDNSKLATLTKRSLQAVEYALLAEKNRRQLPTRYERLLSKDESLSGLLRAYYQETVGVDLPAVSEPVFNHRGDRFIWGTAPLRMQTIDSRQPVWAIDTDFQSKSFVFSTDDSKIFDLNDDAFAIIDAENGKIARILAAKPEEYEHSLIGESQDHALLWTMALDFIYGRSLETGAILHRIALSPKGFDSVELSRDGSILAISRVNGDIELWNAVNGELIQTLTTEADEGGQISWQEDGLGFSFLYSTKTTKTSRISTFRREDQTWAESSHWDEDHARTATLSPDGLFIHIGLTTGEVITRALSSPDLVFRRFAEQNQSVVSLRVSDDGERLLVQTADDKIRVLYLGLMQAKDSFQDGPAGSLTFTPDGRHLIVGPTGNGVKIWDLEQRVVTQTIPESEASLWQELALSRDGHSLLLWGPNELSVWNLEAGSLIRSIPITFDRVNSAVISSNGRFVVAGMFGTANTYIWDLTTEREPRILGGGFGSRRGPFALNKVALDPTDRYVATAAMNKPIRIWDLETSAVVEFGEMLTHDRKLKFSADGQQLMALDGGALRVWNLRDQTVDFTYLDNYLNGESIEFNRSASRLFASRALNSLFMWDSHWEDPRVVPMMKGVGSQMALSPDGSLLATEREGTIRLWDMDNDPIRAQLCRRLGSYLSSELCDHL